MTRNGKQRLLSQVGRFVVPDEYANISCKHKFNLVTITWANHYKIEKGQRVAALSYELKKAKIPVRLVKADMVERNSLCDKVSHLGEYGCDQCVCKATASHYDVTTTFREPLRDELSWRRPVAEGKTFLGRKGPAPLHDLLGFEITEGLPVDPMHQLFLGHGHFLFKRFILDDKCHDGLRVKDDILKAVNRSYTNTRVPNEIHRTPRDYDKAWCANEFKVFYLLNGHRVAEIFKEHNLDKIAIMFGRFTFICRALLLGNEWYADVCSEIDMQELIKAHLCDIQDFLGVTAMNANTHSLSHLVHWRKKYRLFELSCEPGECFFGQNKRRIEVKNKHYGRQAHFNRNAEYLAGHDCKDVFSYSNPITESAKGNAIVVDREMKVYR